MEVDLSSKFYPEPFPDGLPIINLARISLAKLLDGDEQEAALLFDVCKDKGFCYLDLMSHEKGVKLVKEAEQVHQAAKEFFGAPVDEKRKFKTRPPETGLLDTGCVQSLYTCSSTCVCLQNFYRYRETGCDAEGNPNKMEMVNVRAASFNSIVKIWLTRRYKDCPIRILLRHRRLRTSPLPRALRDSLPLNPARRKRNPQRDPLRPREAAPDS